LLFSDGQQAWFVVALADNLDLFKTCFLTGLTAVFVAGLGHEPAWQVRTFALLIGCHGCSPFPALGFD
jgi:hypothetical protein